MRNFILGSYLLFTSAALTAQTNYINEDFNASALPSNWTTSAVTGTQTFSFGLNGSVTSAGNSNINGTSMAYFDDDAIGSAGVNNTVELISPFFNNNSANTTILSFDYNFRQSNSVSDSFIAQVYDGNSSSWITVFTQTSDACGNYSSPSCSGNFPTANIDISVYKNAFCRIRFLYHDGNDWSWYIGIDNVRVYEPISTSIEEGAINNALQISPNPSKGKFNLDVSTEIIGQQYNIFDLKGSLVKQGQIKTQVSQMNLSNLEKGIYFIQIEGHSITERIVVF